MTVARSVADVLNDHVVFEIECIDRMYRLRFTDRRVQALLHALLVFRLLPHGFANRDLRDLLAPLLGLTPGTITTGQMSYDLRRLRATD